MDDDLERRIRERAHAIWEREGRPDGRHDEHWRQASEDVGQHTGSSGSAETSIAPGGGGLASGLQPGGIVPGGGPGATVGSLGTGGGSTGNAPTGDLGRGPT
ncbi:DUF2934 domain-containing protein [Rubellimicrobium arenae]|uniref:DUF2934 domain-containing protein n=1 Tax=Rubellimicrobium arenae TaxID=2817372 RepID=UPI001B313C03|nr:DUF2934 domain-containing protein [Rubellimicrobium arenae]